MKLKINTKQNLSGRFSVHIQEYFYSAWQLAKVPLCLLIGCSAAFGSALAAGEISWRGLVAPAGVFLLAMGVACLNSVQEVGADAAMSRTANRPLVQQRVSFRFAVVQATVLIFAGFAVIFLGSVQALAPIVLACCALFLYNGVYTKLKQHTVLAIAPGAVCGALPPIIGWAAAGGPLLSYLSLLIFVLLFLWQVPHFYLVLLRHKADYQQANQPSFLRLLSEQGVRRLSVVWVSGLALVMMLFTISKSVQATSQQLLIVANALGTSLFFIHQLLRKTVKSYGKLFILLNVVLLNHMVLVMAFLPFR